MLNIEKRTEAETLVIALEGRLDTTTSPELEAVLGEVQDDAEKLTLDLEKLEYISSAGLRVFLAAEKKMSRKGGMQVVHVGETVREIFEVTGFSDILTIVD